MVRTVKIGIITSALVAAISISLFLYLTRGVAAPTEAVQDSLQELVTAEVSSNQTIYRISQSDSQVSYTLQEELNGADKTVVGTTTHVAGEVLIDIGDLSQSRIGEIRINARTFATDDTRRDNAVARFVLQSESDANQYITFQPVTISALSQRAAVGDELNLTVTGDLTIAGVTKEVTFAVTARLASQDQLTGRASVTIQRADFDLNIPHVSFVANVGDSVTINFSFVASAVSA